MLINLKRMTICQLSPSLWKHRQDLVKFGQKKRLFRREGLGKEVVNITNGAGSEGDAYCNVILIIIASFVPFNKCELLEELTEIMISFDM